MSAAERLDATAGFWRARLSVPLDRFFTVGEDPVRLPKATTPLAPNQFQVPPAVLAISDAERQALLAALHRPPDLTDYFRQGSTSRLFLRSIVYRLRTPLSAEERETLRRQQAAELAYFDECFVHTRETLLHLVERGAEPVVMLSLLFRYARLKGPEFPLAPTKRLEAYDFVAVIPHRRRELPLAPLLRRDVPVRLEARTTVTPLPRVRRPGPAETGMNAGMALLARHLTRDAKRPHHAAIGALFQVWGQSPSALEPRPVWRRIFRIKQQHAKDYRHLILQHHRRAQAERATFELYKGQDQQTS